jgi:O-antigen/teichoic acid export membrane protein
MNGGVVKDQLGQLAGHGLVYGIGSALSAAGGFVLIPLYANMLSTEEFGILELLNRTADILLLFMLMGVRQGFMRFYFEKDDEEWHKTVVFTTIVLVTASGAVIASIFFSLKEMLAEILFSGSASGTLFVFVMVWIMLSLFVRIGMTYLQIQMHSVKYVTISLINFALFIISNIILVYVYKKGIIGVLLSNIWVSAVVGLSFLAVLLRWTGAKFCVPLAKSLLKFGLPFLPTACIGFILMNCDRYLLTIFCSLGEVGIYSLAYKIGFLGLGLMADSFGKVWGPFIFNNYDKAQGHEVIGKAFTYLSLVYVLAGLAICMMSPILIPLISAKAFHVSYKLVPLICLGSVFYSMASLADAGILISKKTSFKPLIFAVSCITALAANILLVPRIGMSGASIAIALSFLSLLIINLYFSNKFYKIQIEYKKLVLMFLSGIVVYILFYCFFHQGSGGTSVTIAVILSFLMFGGALWAGGFFTHEEKEVVKGFVAHLRFRSM